MGFAVPSLLGRFGQGFCVGGGEREAAVAAGPEGPQSPPAGGRLHPASRSIWGEGSRGREENSSPRGQATAGPGSVNAREARGAAAGPRAGQGGWRRRAAQTPRGGRAVPCRAAPRPPRRRRDLRAGGAGRAHQGKLGRARPGRGVEAAGQSLGKLPGPMCRGQGGPRAAVWAARVFPARRLQGSSPSLHEGWKAKAERARAQPDRATAGVDLAGPGAAHRLLAPPVGTGGGEELETNFSSFARQTGFSTMITTFLHKS